MTVNIKHDQLKAVAYAQHYHFQKYMHGISPKVLVLNLVLSVYIV